jgi:predicted nucleic acid-binding protein
MKIIVDTCIWSLALRHGRQTAHPAVKELEELIQEARVQLLGPIRQELLSGIKSDAQFLKLRDRLRAFPDFPLDSSDFESAAGFYNVCRGKGVQGSNTDFLICAVAQRHGMPIFTNDRDFEHYQELLSIQIHLWGK